MVDLVVGSRVQGRIIKVATMQLNTTIQNTWKAENVFHVLPSFVFYHNNDMLTNDYGIVFSWLIFSAGLEMWFD